MSTIQIDSLRDLSAREENGRLVEAVREAKLQITGASDWPSMVEDAYGLLNSSGFAINDSFGAIEPNLVVSGRSLSLVRDQQTFVIATIRYRFKRVLATWEGGISLRQVRSQRDKEGDPIILKYKYPDDYKVDPEFAGQEIEQGGEVTTDKPIARQTARFVIATDSPGNLLRQWAGHVNSSSWNGGAKRTWKVVRATAREFNVALNTPEFEFEFEFEHDPDTHDPEVVFVDPNTNQIPPDVLEASGDVSSENPDAAKTVKFAPERDFNNIPIP